MLDCNCFDVVAHKVIMLAANYQLTIAWSSNLCWFDVVAHKVIMLATSYQLTTSLNGQTMFDVASCERHATGGTCRSAYLKFWSHESSGSEMQS